MEPAAEGVGVVPFFFLFGDYQGSAQLMMSNEADPSTATIHRNAYTPYGAVREFDPDGSAGSASAKPLTIERGWLSQVADEATASLGTGLTYLNARYYDPVASRFISPDPMLDVMDPKTLDPYRYAENNPVFYSDSTGLYAKKDEEVCGHYGCAGKTDDPFTYGVGLNGKEAKGKVKSFTTSCTGPRKQQRCTTLEPWEVRARLNHANAEAKCAMGIASGSCEHINAKTDYAGPGFLESIVADEFSLDYWENDWWGRYGDKILLGATVVVLACWRVGVLACGVVTAGWCFAITAGTGLLTAADGYVNRGYTPAEAVTVAMSSLVPGGFTRWYARYAEASGWTIPLFDNLWWGSVGAAPGIGEGFWFGGSRPTWEDRQKNGDGAW